MIMKSRILVGFVCLMFFVNMIVIWSMVDLENLRLMGSLGFLIAIYEMINSQFIFERHMNQLNQIGEHQAKMLDSVIGQQRLTVFTPEE